MKYWRLLADWPYYLIIAVIAWVFLSNIIGRFSNPGMTETQLFLHTLKFLIGDFKP